MHWKARTSFSPSGGQVDNIILTKGSKHGTSADYLLARIKRDEPEGQAYNVRLTKEPKHGNTRIERELDKESGDLRGINNPYGCKGKENQTDNISLIKDSQRANGTLTKCSRVEKTNYDNVRISSHDTPEGQSNNVR